MAASTGLIKWIHSWFGFEEERLSIQNIARRIVATDGIVGTMFAGSIATGLICEAMWSPSSTRRNQEITDAANAQNELFVLHDVLVNIYHLEYDFVHREWATILDPSAEEAEWCKKLTKDPLDRLISSRKKK